MAWKIRRNQGSEAATDRDRLPFKVRGRVGRLECPPGRVFAKRYLKGNRPVVVTGALDAWPALTGWNDDYLQAVAGDRSIEVIVSNNGLFPDYQTKPEPMAKVQIPFREFLQRAQYRDNRPDPILAKDETYYIYGKPFLFQAAPKLGEDVAPPPCLEGIEVSPPNVWISSPGCVTPLHYDLTNGFLGQVRGSKLVYLFPPDQRECLYQRGPHFPGLDNYERQSQVDIHHPHWKSFPKFKQAQALEAVIRPGDALFIPSNWFHEVETLEFSISVGFTFAGGTTTSQFAAMADAFKQARGGEGASLPPGQSLDPASLAPEALLKMMELPMFQDLLRDPKALAMLQNMMPKPPRK